jgi:hypothetical protein
MFGIAGVAALRVVIRALATEDSKGWRTAVFGVCTVFVLVGGQLSWALRPYLVRPRAQDVQFVRELEGSLFDAITTTFRSTRGIYLRDEAPL